MSIFRVSTPALFLTVLCAWPAVAQTEGTPVLFPGGASSISEAHGDWTLVCGEQDEIGTCVVTQNLSNSQTGQRVLALELEPLADGSLEGTLVLPFGLLLADGVRPQVDAVNVGDVLSVAVCYDYGCLVDLGFDAAGVDLLRRGTTLRFVGTIADSGESVSLSLPLGGISSALERATTLTVD